MIKKYHVVKDGYVIASGESHEDHIENVLTYGGELRMGEAPSGLSPPPNPEKTYSQKRREEYPPISDFIDAMYWKERGDDSKYVAYLNQCDEVKKKFPKT